MVLKKEVRMSRVRIFTLAGLLVLACIGTAEAGLGVGARYSYVHNNGLDDNSSMIGVMVRLRHMMFFGLEAAIDHRREEMNDGSKLNSTPLTASLMVYPVPFVYGLAGVGLYRTSIETNSGAEASDSQIGYHYGAGVEVPLLPLLKLTGDIRYQFIDYEFEDIPGSLGKVDADGYAVSAGVIFYLK
jgi:opacity protein-like surface antigen